MQQGCIYYNHSSTKYWVNLQTLHDEPRLMCTNIYQIFNSTIQLQQKQRKIQLLSDFTSTDLCEFDVRNSITIGSVFIAFGQNNNRQQIFCYSVANQQHIQRYFNNSTTEKMENIQYYVALKEYGLFLSDQFENSMLGDGFSAMEQKFAHNFYKEHWSSKEFQRKVYLTEIIKLSGAYKTFRRIFRTRILQTQMTNKLELTLVQLIKLFQKLFE